MNLPRLRSSALLFSGLAAGFGLCMNVVHYRTWALVPAAAFPAFQNASAWHTVPLAALIGLPSLALAVAVARGGAPRAALWAAAALAAVPWVATPIWLVPLQGQLAASGPTAALVGRLVTSDLLLRVLPPLLQAGLQWWALTAGREAAAARPTARAGVSLRA